MMDRNLSHRAKQILARLKQEPTTRLIEESVTFSDIVIEPASPTAREIYWEQADGRIVGGVKPEFLAIVGTSPTASFWIVTEYQGLPRWIRSDRLRSRQAFEKHGAVGEREIMVEEHDSLDSGTSRT